MRQAGSFAPRRHRRFALSRIPGTGPGSHSGIPCANARNLAKARKSVCDAGHKCGFISQARATGPAPGTTPIPEIRIVDLLSDPRGRGNGLVTTPVSGAVTPPGNRLREADEARDEAIQVDAFDPETHRALTG